MKSLIGFTRTAMIAAALTIPALAQDTGTAGSRSGSSTSSGSMSTSPDMGVDRMSRTSPMEHDRDFDLGWMGLLGLAGLAGLRRKRTHSTVHHDMHHEMGHDVNTTHRL
jgi:MYXO-CTERM domain-containing protein